MSALIQPVALLLIILAGYLFKRAGLFEDRDYRIMQTIIFNLVLPGAIVYSFATNPHDSSMLLISLFGLIVAFIPPVVVFLTSRHRPVQNRAFMMLNVHRKSKNAAYERFRLLSCSKFLVPAQSGS